MHTHIGKLRIRRRPGRDCRDPESMDGEQRHVPVIWITEYLHVFCPAGQLRCSKIAPGNFYPAIPAGMTLDLILHFFV